jgi:hypothetical protein
MSPAREAEVTRFPWRETRERLLELWRLGGARYDAAHHEFVATSAAGDRLFVRPPPILVTPTAPVDLETFLDRLEYLESLEDRADSSRHLDPAKPVDPPWRGALLLLRAGSAALGLYDGDVLLAHKVFTRYVVRGHGKAQPSHLRSKGKSRYGSRLRLRNHEALLVETNERLHAFARDHFPFVRLDLAAVSRMRAELEATPPGIPRGVTIVPVPLSVHEPRFDELRRVRFELTHGAAGRRESSR